MSGTCRRDVADEDVSDTARRPNLPKIVVQQDERPGGFVVGDTRDRGQVAAVSLRPGAAHMAQAGGQSDLVFVALSDGEGVPAASLGDDSDVAGGNLAVNEKALGGRASDGLGCGHDVGVLRHLIPSKEHGCDYTIIAKSNKNVKKP